MESFYATKLDEFAKGKISRRALLETLTVAATTTAAATTASAAPASDPTLKIQLVNHISYNCPDFRKGADWYSKVFNLDQVGATKIDVALPFGKKGEKPFGVTASWTAGASASRSTTTTRRCTGTCTPSMSSPRLELPRRSRRESSAWGTT